MLLTILDDDDTIDRAELDEIGFYWRVMAKRDGFDFARDPDGDLWFKLRSSSQWRLGHYDRDHAKQPSLAVD